MFSTLFAVSLLHWVILVTPGANVLLVSQLAASGHRESALLAALGISVVAVTWASLAVLGVNAIFAMHPQLRLTLQIGGAFYLIYVAIRLWRTNGTYSSHGTQPLGAWSAFRLGFLTNILNPKSALFFGSVFATSLPMAPSSSLLFAVVATVFINALCWHALLATLFSHPKIQAGYARQRSLLTRFAGVIVGALGLRLLFSALQELKVRG